MLSAIRPLSAHHTLMAFFVSIRPVYQNLTTFRNLVVDQLDRSQKQNTKNAKDEMFSWPRVGVQTSKVGPKNRAASVFVQEVCDSGIYAATLTTPPVGANGSTAVATMLSSNTVPPTIGTATPRRTNVNESVGINLTDTTSGYNSRRGAVTVEDVLTNTTAVVSRESPSIHDTSTPPAFASLSGLTGDGSNADLIDVNPGFDLSNDAGFNLINDPQFDFPDDTDFTAFKDAKCQVSNVSTPATPVEHSFQRHVFDDTGSAARNDTQAQIPSASSGNLHTGGPVPRPDSGIISGSSQPKAIPYTIRILLYISPVIVDGEVIVGLNGAGQGYYCRAKCIGNWIFVQMSPVIH
jgi:hypothetical protein